MPEQRQRLELQPNEAQVVTIKSDPIVGKNDYGLYYLFIVINSAGQELSFFAPNEEIFNQLKAIGKGKKLEITKTVKQNGKGIKTDYSIVEVEQPVNDILQKQTDNYYSIMVQCYEDSIKIQEKFNGLVDVNRISLTLFIARSKLNGGY